MKNEEFMKIYDKGREFEKKRIVKIIKEWSKRIESFNKSRGINHSGKYVYIITRVINWKGYIKDLKREIKFGKRSV